MAIVITAGLDVEDLDFALESLGEFAHRERPAASIPKTMEVAGIEMLLEERRPTGVLEDVYRVDFHRPAHRTVELAGRRDDAALWPIRAAIRG